jgi:hypothetical protein
MSSVLDFSHSPQNCELGVYFSAHASGMGMCFQKAEGVYYFIFNLYCYDRIDNCSTRVQREVVIQSRDH